ncbi:MAG: AbrB/MazE/SpoVT family DNA-binding domain-containing protein [Coriobacteriales bacterium]|nr:AbrB/MazE/SpoVT family DNA-binding domain-containing protein [Coriobacteriales bacterium]
MKIPGNSPGIRIPKEAAERAGIQQGSRIDLQVGKNDLISLKPRKKDYTLEELASHITPDNRHYEVDWGTERQELL